MTIYILYFSNFQGEDEFIGAFSTEEKARAVISRHVRMEQSSMRIESYELDSE